jgi:hypothetical protein
MIAKQANLLYLQHVRESQVALPVPPSLCPTSITLAVANFEAFDTPYSSHDPLCSQLSKTPEPQSAILSDTS